MSPRELQVRLPFETQDWEPGQFLTQWWGDHLPPRVPPGMGYLMLAEVPHCLRSRKTVNTLELSFLVGKVGAGTGLNSKPQREQWPSVYG